MYCIIETLVHLCLPGIGRQTSVLDERRPLRITVHVGGHNVGHIKTPALLVDCCVSNLYLCPVFWESCTSSTISSV